MAEPTADQVTPDTVVQVSANLEAYISERAGRMAETALARAKTEAAEQIDAVWKAADAEQRRQEDLITELRRQLEACDRLIRRQKDNLKGAERGERAADQQVETLQRELDEMHRELSEERRTADALRKNRDQLNDELRAIRAESERRFEHLRMVAPDHFTPNVLGERKCGCGGQWPCPAYARRESEVTAPEGASPAMTRCPHRDFDDPTRCLLCHP